LWALVAMPEKSVPFLQEHMRPISPADPKHLERLITCLDSPRFAERQQATQELVELDALALLALRQCLRDKPPLEVRRRVEKILERNLMNAVLSPEQLRAVRGIDVLEQIGTPEARQLLAVLAQGAAGARLTLEARTALRPLGQRPCWSLFGGTVRRNMVNSIDYDIPTEWNTTAGEQKNIKWAATLGTRSLAGPVVARGKVFVGTNNNQPRDPRVTADKGVLMCFRESDGMFLWQALHDVPPGGIASGSPSEKGLGSTPVVEGSRVYYVTSAGEVVCSDAECGATVWRLNMVRELNVYPRYGYCVSPFLGSSPLIVDDLLYLVTGNGVDNEGKLPSPQAPSFVALNKKTGKVVWQDNSPGNRIMDGQWSSPAYAEVKGQAQVLFPGGDGWLYAFEPKTGKLLWKFDCNPKAPQHIPNAWVAEDRNFLIAAPAVYDNKVYIGVGRDERHSVGVGHLWCIDLVRAVERGRENQGGDVSPVGHDLDPQAPANRIKSALLWHHGGLAPRAVAQQSDREWLFGRTASTCAVHDGLAYAADMAGYLYCLDARTGQEYWVHDLRSSVVRASPYWVDGKVFIATEHGAVWIFAHGREKKEPKKIETDVMRRGSSVCANGVLYVLGDSTLFAIQEKK